MTEICTIGYEAAAWDPFIAALQQNGVEQIIDVRQLPLSRRPGFSKSPLSAGLAAAGIRYVHLRPLGTPAEGREANKRHDWPRFWSIVDSSLATPEAGLALEHAADLARAHRSCLLCFEADPCICHRRRVGELLTERHAFTLHHLSRDPDHRAAHSRRRGRNIATTVSATSDPASKPIKP